MEMNAEGFGEMLQEAQANAELGIMDDAADAQVEDANALVPAMAAVPGMTQEADVDWGSDDGGIDDRAIELGGAELMYR